MLLNARWKGDGAAKLLCKDLGNIFERAIKRDGKTDKVVSWLWRSKNVLLAIAWA